MISASVSEDEPAVACCAASSDPETPCSTPFTAVWEDASEAAQIVVNTPMKHSFRADEGGLDWLCSIFKRTVPFDTPGFSGQYSIQKLNAVKIVQKVHTS